MQDHSSRGFPARIFNQALATRAKAVHTRTTQQLPTRSRTASTTLPASVRYLPSLSTHFTSMFAFRAAKVWRAGTKGNSCTFIHDPARAPPPHPVIQFKLNATTSTEAELADWWTNPSFGPLPSHPFVSPPPPPPPPLVPLVHSQPPLCFTLTRLAGAVYLRRPRRVGHALR
jgi:hypothetical protein